MGRLPMQTAAAVNVLLVHPSLVSAGAEIRQAGSLPAKLYCLGNRLVMASFSEERGMDGLWNRRPQGA
jgi:hypothetical protein